jgi:hypothetical protein
VSESSTKTLHRWVEMTITPVEVVGVDREGEPVIFPTAAPSPRYGCNECLTGLNPNILTEECPGRDELDDLDD